MRLVTIILSIVCAAGIAYAVVGEPEPIARKETDNVEVYNNYRKGLEHYRRNTPADWAQAAAYLKTAIELDPNYGRAYALLAQIYDQSAVLYMGWYSGRASALGVSYNEAKELSNKYRQLAKAHPTSLYHWHASRLRLNERNYDAAISEAEQALALEPDNPDILVQMANVLVFAARPRESFAFADRAMQVDPDYGDPDVFYVSGMAYFSTGEMRKAETLFQKAYRRNSQDRWYAFSFAATCAHLGREKEAQQVIGKVTRGLYDYAVATVMVYMPFKDIEVADRFADGLRKAGMK